MSPLAGKRIIVTRPADRAESLAGRISAAGGVPVLYPTIVTGPPADHGPLDEALRSLADFDWIVFTSASGVRATFHRATEIGILHDAWRSVRIAAVGPATAAALSERGLAPDVVPDSGRGAAFATAIPGLRGSRLLFARGNLALQDATDAVQASGGTVLEVQAYATDVRRDVDTSASERLRACDAITFTSPSTLHGFLNALGDATFDARVRIVTIGPTTSAAVNEAGLVVHAEAEPHTEAGLMNALAQAFA